MIDPSLIQVVNSPNVLSWPITTGLTQIDIFDNGVNPYFDKKNTWPEVTPPGWSGPMEFTLWLMMKIDGNWIGSGIIQFYRGLVASGGAIYSGNQIAKNWVYDSRWAPMTGHQPAPGELIGFMVSAGNARNQDNHIIEERSQIVTLNMPSGPQSFQSNNPTPDPIPDPKTQLDRIEANTIEILRRLN